MWIKPALFMYSLILFSSEGTWGCDPIKTQGPEYIAVDVFLLFFVSVSQIYEEHAWKQKSKKATAGKMKHASPRIVQTWLCLVIEILKNYCKRIRKYIFISLIHSLVIGTGITSQHASLSFIHWTTSFSFFLCMSLNNKMLCLKRVINNFWILYL